MAMNDLVRLLAASGAALVVGSALAQAAPGAETVSRIIVKFRDTGSRSALATSSRVARIAADVGVAMSYRRSMALGAQVLTLDHPLSRGAAAALVAGLARHPDIEFVQADRRRRPALVPNDTYIGSQTYLQNSPGGTSAIAAWDATTGSPNTVVAVVDTGYRAHADLAGRVLPGYDFISNAKDANDGDGRDADATDPGDWVSTADAADPEFAGCDLASSSWHGTGVAGIIAANANNNQWLAGLDWAAKILPVRVLGKCGGDDSDILDGIAWAAGLSVPGVPVNPHPAQIINVSLGGPGECPAGYVSVFSAALARGVTRAIVVAAGNEGGDVADSAPANCPQAIAVAATTMRGSLAGYSNYGAGIALSAPGGTAVNSDWIFVLSNTGATAPADDSFAPEAGTSTAAPMVAGVVSLMLAVAPNLSAAQVRALLSASAKPFPAGSTCGTSICGAGIVDAEAAVRAAITLTGSSAFNGQGLWWATGGTESGWGINFAHQGDQVFGTWYTYDTSGKAWWLSMLANRITGNTYTGDILATTGPPFNAVPFSPVTAPATKVGTGTLTFTDGNNGSFAYVVNGTAQTKPISRYDLGTGPQPMCIYSSTTPNFTAAANYQDLWWVADGAESGWGVNFAHQGNSIFATWYTYDSDGTPLWLSVLAPRVGTSNAYSGHLYRTAGPRFDAYVGPPASSIDVGTAKFTFADGNHATFAYSTTGAGNLPIASQSKQVTRFPFAPAGGTLCQ